MRPRALFLVLSLIASCAIAEDRLSEGGRSPDGSHEVRIVRQDLNGGPDGYGIQLHSTKTAKSIFTLAEIGGYLRYGMALERDQSYWHGSSRCVAITDQGSRHSRELYAVWVSEEGKATVLQPPDFYQNALGRIDAVRTDFASVVTPQKWEGDDLILQLHLTANQRRSYTFEVVLHLNHEPQSTPYLSLKSVKKLKEGQG